MELQSSKLLKYLPKLYASLPTLDQSSLLTRSFQLLVQALTDFTCYLPDTNMAIFPASFQRYLLNAFLIHSNSPFIFPDTDDGQPSSMLLLHILVMDKSGVLEHLEKHLDEAIEASTPSFQELISGGSCDDDNHSERGKQMARRRINVYERAMQKQIVHNITITGENITKGKQIIDPYQVAYVQQTEQGGEQERIEEVKGLQEEKIKLQKARVKMLEIMDKLSEQLEGNEDLCGQIGNPYFIEDEDYFDSHVKQPAIQVIDKIKLDTRVAAQFTNDFLVLEQALLPIKSQMKKSVPAEELRLNLQSLEAHLSSSLSHFKQSPALDYHYAIYPFLHSIFKSQTTQNEKPQNVQSAIDLLKSKVEQQKHENDIMRQQFDKQVDKIVSETTTKGSFKVKIL